MNVLWIAGLGLIAAAGAPATAEQPAAPAPATAQPTAPAPAADGGPHWVFFRDRGPDAGGDSTLAAAARALAPRALARRAKAARERGEVQEPARPGGAGARGAAADHAAPPLVDARDLEPSAEYAAAIRRAGATIRTSSRWLNAVSVDGPASALAAIRTLPFVLEVRPVAAAARDEEGAEVAATASGGVSAADQFSYGRGAHQIEMIGVPEAHAMGFHGEGVLVCILDSGFELGHEALDQLEVRAARDFLFNDENVAFDPRQDVPGQSNHGTTVLSVLAGYAPGRLVGPAYLADYILGKTESNRWERPVEEDTWCAGIEWAEAMGADMVTTSLSYTSWYGPASFDGRTAVVSRTANLAFHRGLLLVNSIGNQGPKPGTLGAPSDAPGVIAVGSVDWNGRISEFSSRGPTWDRRVKPDLVAMGSGVSMVTAGTRDRYGSGSGTSYAAPLVAGCAALVLSAHPDWGPEAVRDALVMSGDRAAMPGSRYGWGVPNARDAILYPLIEGRVTDVLTREPIAGARVSWEPAGTVDTTRVVPSDSPPRGAVRADSTGAYVVPNLPRGVYRLRVNADGYFEFVTEALEVPPNLGDVNVALRYRGE